MAEKPDLKSVQCRFESDHGDVPAKKRKVVDAPMVYREGEEKLVKFGWCSTGQDDKCRVEFPGHRCSCECHESGGSDAGRSPETD